MRCCKSGIGRRVSVVTRHCRLHIARLFTIPDLIERRTQTRHALHDFIASSTKNERQ